MAAAQRRRLARRKQGNHAVSVKSACPSIEVIAWQASRAGEVGGNP